MYMLNQTLSAPVRCSTALCHTFSTRVHICKAAQQMCPSSSTLLPRRPPISWLDCFEFQGSFKGVPPAVAVVQFAMATAQFTVLPSRRNGPSVCGDCAAVGFIMPVARHGLLPFLIRLLVIVELCQLVSVQSRTSVAVLSRVAPSQLCLEAEI